MLLKVSTLKTGKKSKCFWVTQLRKYIVKEWWGTREFVYLKKKINFWNRLKFPNKNPILLGSFKESFGGIRERARQSDQRRAVWKCGQSNDILVCSSSESLTTENQIHFRNRLKFLNKDLIFVNFERTFRWKICESFWLPGINYLRLCPIAFSHSVYKNLNISYLITHFNPPIQKKKRKNSCMHSMRMFPMN